MKRYFSSTKDPATNLPADYINFYTYGLKTSLSESEKVDNDINLTYAYITRFSDPIIITGATFPITAKTRVIINIPGDSEYDTDEPGRNWTVRRYRPSDDSWQTLIKINYNSELSSNQYKIFPSTSELKAKLEIHAGSVEVDDLIYFDIYCVNSVLHELDIVEGVLTITSNYDITSVDQIKTIIVDHSDETTGLITITLPALSGNLNRKIEIIQKGDGLTDIIPDGDDTLEYGRVLESLFSDNDNIVLFGDSDSWKTIKLTQRLNSGGYIFESGDSSNIGFLQMSISNVSGTFQRGEWLINYNDDSGRTTPVEKYLIYRIDGTTLYLMFARVQDYDPLTFSDILITKLTGTQYLKGATSEATATTTGYTIGTDVKHYLNINSSLFNLKYFWKSAQFSSEWCSQPYAYDYGNNTVNIFHYCVSGGDVQNLIGIKLGGYTYTTISLPGGYDIYLKFILERII